MDSTADNTVARPPYASITQPCVGLLVSIDEEGRPHVACAAIADGLPAPCRIAVPLDRAALGRSVLLLPDPRDGVPIIAGVVQDRIETAEVTALPASFPVTISTDEDELTLVAAQRISLRCGKASITLDAEGHVEIRGQYVLSRAARQNKIKGASVSFN